MQVPGAARCMAPLSMNSAPPCTTVRSVARRGHAWMWRYLQSVKAADSLPALLNIAELASFLGRGRDFATGLLEDGVLPVIWQRKRRYVSRAVVEAWLASGGEVPEVKPKVRTFPRQVRAAKSAA